MTKRSLPTLLALATALLLAACGSGSSNNTAPAPTLPAFAPGAMHLVEGCRPADVDNWSERATYLSEAFGAAMVQAANTAPADLEAAMTQMYAYKKSLDTLPVPAGCAQETQELINALTYEIINTFEAYRIDPNVDVRAVVARGQATIELIQLRTDEIADHMDATYEATHSDS